MPFPTGIGENMENIRYQEKYIQNGAKITYLSFPMLEETGMVEHLFTTRLGGVSEGEFATLNLSFDRGDDPVRVLENYRRIGEVLGTTPERMVCSKQTHTTNIMEVRESDCGSGVVKERAYTDIDGLMTDIPGICLVTSYADCVPLYFLDPVHRAIGLAHSGWRGTVGGMGACMVRSMGERYGSRPEELLAAIGPSICRDCYEVSADVAEAFREMLLPMKQAYQQVREAKGYDGDESTAADAVIHKGRIVAGEQKYQLDLWLANQLILVHEGVPISRISLAGICTCEHADLLFSHRATGGKRGNLGAFMMLR